MLCMECGAEMRLVEVAKANTMPVSGFEHRTWQCSGCSAVEQRMTFTREKNAGQNRARRTDPSWVAANAPNSASREGASRAARSAASGPDCTGRKRAGATGANSAGANGPNKAGRASPNRPGESDRNSAGEIDSNSNGRAAPINPPDPSGNTRRCASNERAGESTRREGPQFQGASGGCESGRG